MWQILSLLTTGILLWLSTKVFPSEVIIEDWTTLIFAAVIFYVIETIVLAICVIFLIPVYRRDTPTKLLLGICITIASIVGALTLSFLCPVLGGYVMSSFWIALLISVTTCLLSVHSRTTR